MEITKHSKDEIVFRPTLPTLHRCSLRSSPKQAQGLLFPALSEQLQHTKLNQTLISHFRFQVAELYINKRYHSDVYYFVADRGYS